MGKTVIVGLSYQGHGAWNLKIRIYYTQEKRGSGGHLKGVPQGSITSEIYGEGDHMFLFA